ncbi:MAG: hypothetical protein ACYDDI_02485 [Candidatus Acidiferrales bacterium]
MFNQVIWWGCIALEVLLVARLAQNKLPKKFPIFYSYLGCVLSIDLLAIPIYRSLPSFYSSFYWSAEFLTAILGYGVITEIYNRSLKSYPGVSRFIRIVLISVLFVIIVKACANFLGGSAHSFSSSTVGLEGDLRTVQAVMLVALLGIFMAYQIPIERNLRGIILGYSLFVGFSVIDLTIVLKHANRYGPLMRKLEPISYLVCLAIWASALWSLAPEPECEATGDIEKDYELIFHQTKAKVLRARAYLVRTVRS